MKADILAKKGTHQLIVEIFYRHKVDDQKRKKIAEARVSAIEINLSALLPKDVEDWEAFWLYINDPQHAQWLYNAKVHHADYPELEKQVAEKIQEQEEKYKQEELEQRKAEHASFPGNLERPQRKQYSESSSRLLLLSRPVMRRAPPPIDRVRPSSSGKHKGNLNQSFGRKKSRF